MTSLHPMRTAPAAGADAPSLLVVEDDSGMRALFEIYLCSFGYRVHLAASGEEAIAKLGAQPDTQLMIMDVVMPGLCGQRLVDEAKQLRPDLRVLFCSGHYPGELTRYGIDLSGGNFIQKPCSPVDLKQKVAELLPHLSGSGAAES